MFTNLGGDRHRFQFRIDVINFGNLLNKNWGVSQRLVSNSAADQSGGRRPGSRHLSPARHQWPVDEQVVEQAADLNDVYRVMFSLKYFFGS